MNSGLDASCSRWIPWEPVIRSTLVGVNAQRGVICGCEDLTLLTDGDGLGGLP